ncbi:arginase family protein [Mesorhizobium sp. BAC0120]|uniref:arginase family protein n=1 Tax=Mesorhizobium sp. BAC0120 TaxID=3090670 RepID=UPI00298C5689|nr:arginase family protein [Mesorhizobium sp. BAC0120]MDW6021374.1 arginase family protein [Mesorhizobium sp. BAC0120]
MTRRPIVIIEAPTNLGLMPPAPGQEPGTRHAPDVLRELGLHDQLNVREVVRVEPGPYSKDEGRSINIRNVEAIAEHALRLSDAIETAIMAGGLPLVLGGDCSLLIGSMLCMRRLGEPALLFIDGHSDFFLPEQSSTGGAAGMDLALATGWGPPELTDLEARRPYVPAGHVAALGNRDFNRRREADIPDIADAGFYYRSLVDMRHEGIERATGKAVAAITSNSRRCWIHLDVDAIDSALMPAVDSPQADGFSWTEIEKLLRAAQPYDAAGMQVTIYDPERDPGHTAGKALVDLLVSVLG